MSADTMTYRRSGGTAPLEMTLTNQNYIHEVKRIEIPEVSSKSVQNLLFSRLLCMNLNIKFKATDVPVVLYRYGTVWNPEGST
jgi:hypothetical protein